MTHDHRSIEERLSALEEENRRLRERLDRAEGKLPSNAEPMSRRAVLAQAGAAIGIGATLGVVGIGSDRAQALTGDMFYGFDNDAGGYETILRSWNGNQTLQVINTRLDHPGRAIQGTSTSDAGVAARSQNFYGMMAHSFNATGARITTGSEYGAGLEVVIEPAVNGRAAVESRTNGSGYGVFGVSATGTGVGGQGLTGPGLHGTSRDSVGGVFEGKTAQIRLRPSTAVSYPARGARGDLFVDRLGRLWYCRGGATWVRLDA